MDKIKVNLFPHKIKIQIKTKFKPLIQMGSKLTMNTKNKVILQRTLYLIISLYLKGPKI